MWQVDVGAGNGALGLESPFGGVPGLCGDPFQGDTAKPASNFAGMLYHIGFLRW